MKSILMSIRPEWVAKILNGEKTIEIRKKFPKDYVGWVYIYVTKGNNEYLVDYRNVGGKFCITPTDDLSLLKEGKTQLLNGKVVARFWCDKVEYIENYYDEWRDGEEDYRTETLNPNKLYEKSCLPFEEMDKYLQGDYGYAIHITNLEIFDEPKEISEFKYICPNVLCDQCKYGSKEIDLALPICKRQITNAPQNYYYIEVDL